MSGTSNGTYKRLSRDSLAHGVQAAVVVLLALAVTGVPTRQSAASARNDTTQVVSRSTPHLKFAAAISPAVIAADARLSIAVDVVPKRGMHVFAPGTQYRPIAVSLQTDSLYRVQDPIYPKPTVYVFQPLKEDVLVYDRPFRLLVELTVRSADTLRTRLRGLSQTTLTGRLDYQACDDRVCYLPTSVPFQWTLRVAR